MIKNFPQVGRNLLKTDAFEKVTGTAAFGNDMEMDGMLYGKVARSRSIHAKVIDINVEKALRVPGVVKIITHKDIPGENSLGMIIKDEPVLVENTIRRYGDPLCLIAAETKEAAEAAAELVEVHAEELPVLTDPLEAMKDKAPLLHTNSNVALSRKLIKNDVDKSFESCEIIVENTYKTPAVAHAFLEPQVSIASYQDNILTFWASSQNIHFDRKEVCRVLNLPQSRVRGVQTVTGGGFGGKLDIASQCHAALLSYHTQRPVKINHSFEETMHTSSKRHPYYMKYKTGADREGRILALDAELILDTGAYCSYGPGVLIRGMVHAPGPYEIFSVRVKGYLVYTNNPMAGAMRGFGVPQVAVAHESQMDIIAERVGIDPYEIRQKNALREGSRTSTNQVLSQSVGISQTIEEARNKTAEIINNGEGK